MSELEPHNTPPPDKTTIRWGPIALVGGVLALYLLTSPRAAPLPEGWMVDYDEAVAEAVATDRHMLVAFNMKGCGPCTMMDRLVLPEPRIIAALQALVPLRVNVDRQWKIAERFHVRGTPTYAVIDVKGNVLDQCSGFQPVDRFLGFVRRGSTLSYDSP